MSSSQDQEMFTWKYEPVSPSGASLVEIDEDWPLFNNQSVEISNNAADAVMYDDHPTRAQVATKLLEELDEWIKEEPFSDWLEEKIELPIFEQIPFYETNNKPTIVYSNVVKASHQQQQQQQHDKTQTLLKEFETVLDDVEACHQIIPATSSTTLTPPQSPSHKAVNVDTQLLVTLQPVQPFTGNQSIYNIAAPQDDSLYVNNTSRQWNTENISLSPLGGDVANELAVVDEFIRSHTKDILSPSSPCSSGGSSVSADDTTDDPDWTLENEKRSLKHTVHDSSKHRHKPYSRSSLDDKKVRKKEQNKNAATRYRQKKKQEIKEIQGEERELADHNESLKEKVKNLQQEIGYLKGLMRDVFKAKGLLK